METSLSEHNASLAIIFGDVGASKEVLKQRGWTSENKMGLQNSIRSRKFKILSGAIIIIIIIIIIINYTRV
jgi:hypothetical protein